MFSKVGSTAEETFAFQLRCCGGVDGLEREYRFHPKRRWRFDFAWPEFKVAVEVEGVVWGGSGRHQRAAGYAADCEKYNEALLLGWRVLRVTQRQVNDGTALNWLQLLVKEWNNDAIEN